MQIYPYSSPIILSDSVFTMYGGQTGTFGAAQRNAAYVIAEQQATTHIGAFLLPTIVTGTFPYSSRIPTDYGYVSRVLSVGVLSKSSNCVLQSASGCVFVWEDTFGYLDPSCIINSCNCAGWSIPYQFQIAYESGLPTGTANQPGSLLALTMAATISLNEMIFPSQNEAVGDVGVQEFSSIDYSEKRVALGRNAFGSSAKAQKIAQLLNSTIKRAKKSLRLR